MNMLRAFTIGFRGGGEPTNKYLKALGFVVKEKDDVNEDWIDVKVDFAEWLLKNAPITYKNQFLGTTLNSIIEKLNKIETFFIEKKIFIVDKNNIQNTIDYVLLKTNRIGRENNPAFFRL
jgi:hypothetical protein